MRVSIVAGFLVAICIWFGTSTASSSVTYAHVCSVAYHKWNNTSWGDYGYMYASFYTEPNCDGDYLGYHYFCTEGATSAFCPSEAKYLHTENQILRMFSELNSAGDNGTTVHSYTVDCSGGTSDLCATYVVFRHN